VIVLSDNGASSEGGPTGSLNDGRAWNVLPRTVEEAADRIDEIGGPRIHNNYPWGWTVAGNTPFRRWKRETHEGGVADPLIVHWPDGFGARGEVRHQYVHAIDVLPTILDAIGIGAPAEVGGVAQKPIDGVSFRSTFDDAGAPEVRTVQYFEMLGCRALYQDGWKAVTYQEIQADEPRLDQAVWELYDLRADPSECHDLASTEPDRLAAMIDRWWEEAERNQVLPLDNRPFSELVFQRTPTVAPRARYTYWPGRAPVPESVAVNVRSRAHDITAHVTIPDGLEVVEGVLAVQGSVLGGWSFHLLADGRLVYVHNLAGWRLYRVEASIGRLAPGDHTLAFRFRPPAAELLVDEAVVGTGEVTRTVWSRFSLTGAGLTAGWSPDFSPADEDYRDRFAFTGTLHKVDIDVEGLPVVDAEAEAEAIIAAQ
jgi:Sulfatase